MCSEVSGLSSPSLYAKAELSPGLPILIYHFSEIRQRRAFFIEIYLILCQNFNNLILCLGITN
ncbi:MAG: hypothetical protein A3A10_01490 [Candidatus Tagabacteria bacterium RIFCSPLOWO2_01_FULL_42_9]|uniref:Uncharacterized protein n=1 Tax=Candidatus Tagabacteria bacterium RIFCSPLOWO2_01_FULL_42_9 TaxID=1802296 RepID=A0A1G2LWK9_9BACT|nr:MAG: hypothetical protein A3A10_01490 [Candidatus Tagabacteria bacterium RIFCSPLOWO2_01_FULL_42_9]